jgi:hypothetical protein
MKIMKMWIDLLEAIRMVMRAQQEDGERMAAFVTYKYWDLRADSAAYVKIKYGAEAVEILPRARAAFHPAVEFLEKLLPQGKVRGGGFHEDTGLSTAITEFEWAIKSGLKVYH